MINLTGQTSLNTDNQGQVIFNNLVPGEYDLSENLSSQPGWHQTNIYCEDRVGDTMITKPGEAYGHHGDCEGWNGYNAATIALWACNEKGYTNLVSYGIDKPCTQFNNCNLFYGGKNDGVQYDWGN
jgi:protocatechuate 3,4-dioxygenase beta subunit